MSKVKAHIERMVRAMAWADGQVLTALRGCPAAQGEALPLLAHLLAAEHIWLTRLQRREARHSVWPQLTLPECEGLAVENAAGYAALLAGLSEAGLGAAVRYLNTKGEEFATPVIDILTHAVIHGAYHRGQIARALGRAGVQAVNTDYITYARTVEPAPSHPSVTRSG
jgi:uncharacterized damage-inducible protein DinB